MTDSVKRLLVVDDSALFRQAIVSAVHEIDGVEVVGLARNGEEAIEKMIALEPDVVTLDVEMPICNGIETLSRMKRREIRIPTIMVSNLTSEGAAVTLEALFLGALDFIQKPSGGLHGSKVFLRDNLRDKIASIKSRRSVVTSQPSDTRLHPRSRKETASMKCRMVLIGCSTGGPNVLRQIMPRFEPEFPLPIVIVQHMPAAYTAAMAHRLDAVSSIRITEASDHVLLRPGNAYVAPGGKMSKVIAMGSELAIALNDDPPENSCRPSVDYTLRSAVEMTGGKMLAAILTGMGKDGLDGCRHLHAAGGTIFSQDEESSDVYGMPKAIAEAGLSDRVLPLGRVAAAISRHVRRAR